jgi:uncharacterized protein YjbJ (UPF0337 family)
VKCNIEREKGKVIMGIPNKDELKGKLDQAKGSIKETVGSAIGDRELEDEGARDKVQGETNETVGKVRRKVGDAISDVGKAIGR